MTATEQEKSQLNSLYPELSIDQPIPAEESRIVEPKYLKFERCKQPDLSVPTVLRTFNQVLTNYYSQVADAEALSSNHMQFRTIFVPEDVWRSEEKTCFPMVHYNRVNQTQYVAVGHTITDRALYDTMWLMIVATRNRVGERLTLFSSGSDESTKPTVQYVVPAINALTPNPLNFFVSHVVSYGFAFQHIGELNHQQFQQLYQKYGIPDPRIQRQALRWNDLCTVESTYIFNQIYALLQTGVANFEQTRIGMVFGINEAFEDFRKELTKNFGVEGLAAILYGTDRKADYVLKVLGTSLNFRNYLALSKHRLPIKLLETQAKEYQNSLHQLLPAISPEAFDYFMKETEYKE